MSYPENSNTPIQDPKYSDNYQNYQNGTYRVPQRDISPSPFLSYYPAKQHTQPNYKQLKKPRFLFVNSFEFKLLTYGVIILIPMIFGMFMYTRVTRTIPQSKASAFEAPGISLKPDHTTVGLESTTVISGSDFKKTYSRLVTIDINHQTDTSSIVNFTLDTKSLISDNKLDLECQNMQIRSTQNSVTLPLYLLSGCNTPKTTFGTIVPGTESTIYPKFNIIYGELEANMLNSSQFEKQASNKEMVNATISQEEIAEQPKVFFGELESPKTTVINSTELEVTVPKATTPRITSVTIIHQDGYKETHDNAFLYTPRDNEKN